MRPHPRRASTSARSPRAWATCDRCGFVSNHYKLSWQYDWRGTQLQNLRILVCEDCLDNPQRQLGTIILPPDPVSIINSRPEQYTMEEQTARLLMDGTVRYQMDGQQRWESNLQTTGESPAPFTIPSSVLETEDTLGIFVTEDRTSYLETDS